jgi:hypothetical protein
VRLARADDPLVSPCAITCICAATTHAAGRAALLSVRGAAAALEEELALLRAALRDSRNDDERARLECLRAAATDALRRLRDPRARQEHEPPRDGPPPGLDGTSPQPATPPVCIACGAAPAPGRRLQQCGACWGPERWCGAACQRATWAAHKAECRERTAGAAAAAAPAGAGGSG